MKQKTFSENRKKKVRNFFKTEEEGLSYGKSITLGIRNKLIIKQVELIADKSEDIFLKQTRDWGYSFPENFKRLNMKHVKLM